MSFEYDVFLSHNSKDKPAVETIANLLGQNYSLRCWLDKWNLVPGEPWQEALEDALDECETVAVFVGPNTISPWENEEMRSALETRVHEKTRRVIPVLLPGAPDSRDLKLPRFLSRLTWVDFRAGFHDEEALYRLYCGIKGIKPGADKIDERATGGGLPPGSYVPFTRNALFTGREADLGSLAEKLLEGEFTNTVISQAVTGMGGIGKTQLAVEFAYRYGPRFKGVHWLDLRDVTALDGAIALCGVKMGYTHADQRELVAATMKHWVEDGPRLLILDNFEDVAQSNEVLAGFQHPSLRLLVTSRRKDFPRATGLRVQELGVFSEPESLDFLEKTLERGETPQARKDLAEKLGHLPLALELAASYININRTGIEGYLEELADVLQHESMQAEWFKELDVANPTKHDQSLFGTFQLSWREVKDETGQKVFMTTGYCAPNTPVPLEIFKETLELEEKDLRKALYRLNALGLLADVDGLPAIHPLLAAYARTAAGSSEGLLEKLANRLAGIARQANDQADQSGSLKWFVPLHPHVFAAAEFAEAAGVQDAAKLLGNLGYYLRKIADYPGAKAADERALRNREQVFGQDHPDVALSLNNLGLVLRDLGDLAGAKASFERALRIGEASYGPDHPNVAIRVNNLGGVLKDLGDMAGAKAAYERALRIDEASYGPDHPNVATLVNNLGLVLRELGDMVGAKAAFERALRIDEASYGPDHPKVAIRVNNLGLVLKDLGDRVEAKAAYERALRIDEASYGPDHPNVARDVNNLGSVLRELGDLAGAKAAFERALRIDEASYGPDHPKVAIRVNNLGGVLKDLGDLAGAKAAYERALLIREVAFGKEHPQVAVSLWWLGVLAQKQDDKEAARDYYERALRIYQKFLPPDHPNIKNLRGYLSSL
jgi:tetratricopeptide (TPR) repeat protein